MSVMIKLQLPSGANNMEVIQKLPGLQDLPLDAHFGVVPIDPKKGLYVVRTDSLNELERRKQLSPEILEAYGDIRISTT